MPAKVNYIKISRVTNTNILRVYLPVDIMDILGNPDRVLIRQYPLRISSGTLADRGTLKVIKIGSNNHQCSFDPIGDIDEYIGRYSYEVDDMTLYLEKIE